MPIAICDAFTDGIFCIEIAEPSPSWPGRWERALVKYKSVSDMPEWIAGTDS